MSKINEDGIPTDFCKIIKEFTNDILVSFPEYKNNLNEGLCNIIDDNDDTESLNELVQYIKSVYPERFFDLLYQNENIFKDSEINTKFLPNIDFSDLWNQEISDNTKNVIWKYLQLVLFSVISGEKDINSFGDTAKLFEAIKEDELKEKLQEAMEQMENLFDTCGNNMNENDISTNDLPNPEDLHSHINTLLEGNLGKLATEITEETLKDLKLDISDDTDAGDIFQTLFKNPGKLMSMIKKVGSKLDTKLKSGELKESELMEEAMELMEKMESMPGMENMKNMMSKMGMPMGGKNGKMNMSAMASNLKQNHKQAKTKERMLHKLEKRREEKKDNQIKILQEQLAAAKKSNTTGENIVKKDKKKKKKKKKKNRNKK
jgi:hypothetical protein